VVDDDDVQRDAATLQPGGIVQASVIVSEADPRVTIARPGLREDRQVSIEVVFETHSWSQDNDLGVATGWLPGQLSERGQGLARELGQRHRSDGLNAVFTSDLRRAAETAALAFADSDLPVLADWRLRECDYGELNGAPAVRVHAMRSERLTVPYPGGESWTQAVARAGRFLSDLPTRWEVSGSS